MKPRRYPATDRPLHQVLSDSGAVCQVSCISVYRLNVHDSYAGKWVCEQCNAGAKRVRLDKIDNLKAAIADKT
jgi:hypothetical protein